MKTLILGFILSLALPHLSRAEVKSIETPVMSPNMPMKHNMVLFGENEIFASHIVYKSPHNYQVILALTLNAGDRAAYLAAKKAHPSEQFTYLLDSMEIKDIASQSSIGGVVFYLDSADQKHLVLSRVVLSHESFRVIFFDELPLSLEADSQMSMK